MLLQRARDAENRVKYRLSNGPLRAQSKVRICAEYSATYSIRKLLGVCWYSAKRAAVVAVNQGGTADKSVYSSLTEIVFSVRDFLMSDAEWRGPSDRNCWRGLFLPRRQFRNRRSRV